MSFGWKLSNWQFKYSHMYVCTSWLHVGSQVFRLYIMNVFNVLSRCFSLYLTLYMLQLPAEALVDHILEAPGILQWFQEAIDVGNPDALLLALKIREKTSIDSTSLSKLLPNPFSPTKLFSAEYLSSIDNCLKVNFIVSIFCTLQR